MLGRRVDDQGQDPVPWARTVPGVLLVAVREGGRVAVVTVGDQERRRRRASRRPRRRAVTGHIRWRTPCSSRISNGARRGDGGVQEVGERRGTARRSCRTRPTGGCGSRAAAGAGPPRGRASSARAGSRARPRAPAPSRRTGRGSCAASPAAGTPSRTRRTPGSSPRRRAPRSSQSSSRCAARAYRESECLGVVAAFRQVEVDDAERARGQVGAPASVADNVVRRRRDPVQRARDGDVVHETDEREEARHAPCIAAASGARPRTTCSRAAGPCSGTDIRTRRRCCSAGPSCSSPRRRRSARRSAGRSS